MTQLQRIVRTTTERNAFRTTYIVLGPQGSVTLMHGVSVPTTLRGRMPSIEGLAYLGWHAPRSTPRPYVGPCPFLPTPGPCHDEGSTIANEPLARLFQGGSADQETGWRLLEGEYEHVFHGSEELADGA